VAGAQRTDGAREGAGRLSAGPAALWGGADYDAIVPYYAPIYDGLVALLGPQPGERFLDIATGTGEIALRAARAGADVTALDISPAMLEIARSKPGASFVRFELGDAQELPYADEAFDVVVSNFGVIFVPNCDAVAGELTRVCRRGGRLGLTVWYRKPELDALWDRFGRTSTVDAYVWSEQAELERLLDGAFELERHERVWRLEGESGEAVYDFWSRVAPPTKAFLDSLDDRTRARARAALVEYWEGFRRDDRVSEPRPYAVVLGTRC